MQYSRDYHRPTSGYDQKTITKKTKFFSGLKVPVPILAPITTCIKQKVTYITVITGAKISLKSYC